MSFNKFRMRQRRKRLSISGPDTVTCAVGQDANIALSTSRSVDVWSIVTGDNGIIEDGVLSIANTDVAGSWTVVVSALDAQFGDTAQKKIILRVTPGSAVLGKVNNLSQVSVTSNTVTVSFNSVTGAGWYQYVLNDINGQLKRMPTDNTIRILEANTQYDVWVRAADANTNRGPWSDMLSITTQDTPASNVGNTLPVGNTAYKAWDVTNSFMVQMYIKNTGDDPYSCYRTGNGNTTGAFSNTGWIMGHWEPLASQGINRVRTAFGYSSGSANNHQVPKIVQKMYSPELNNTKFDLTITPELTDTPSPQTIIDNAWNYFRHAVNSFQGLNEPNSTKHGDWDVRRGLCIDHTIATSGYIRTPTRNTAWANVPLWSFSVWKRDLVDIRRLLYVDAQNNNFTVYTNNNGKQWLRDCLPLIDAVNLHYYTGGRKPTIAGTPGKNFDENGGIAEIALDDTLTNYWELAGNNRSFPIVTTENGWEIGNVDVRATNPNAGGMTGGYKDAFLTDEARMKYFQRSNFEMMNRGVMRCSWFEFIDNANEVPNYSVTPIEPGKYYGMVDYVKHGVGTYSFIRRKLWYMAYYTANAFYDSGSTANSFTTTPLPYFLQRQPGSTSYDLSEIHHRLFQKSDGKWYLAIWWDKESWKRTSPYGNTFGSRPLRMNIGNATVAVTKTMRWVRPYLSANAVSLAEREARDIPAQSWTSINGGTPINYFDFNCHDDITVIEIS
jgi:hypothetical protein